MTTETTRIADLIRGTRPGDKHKVMKSHQARQYILIIRQLADARYELEVAWAVPEAYGDDPNSFGGLLGPGICEVGWAAKYDGREDAAESYVAAKEAIVARKPAPMPEHGERRGNVERTA